jgi:hypothetical protein
VSFYRGRGIGRQSGVEVVRDLAAVYRIRDGLIASERIYLDRDEALEAAGLRKSVDSTSIDWGHRSGAAIRPHSLRPGTSKRPRSTPRA